MPVTIKKLAAYANVSIATVSRALNNDPLIAQKTREKIQALAKDLNYVPNNFGRGLRAQKSRLIGYLIANIHDSFYNEIMQGIGQIVSQRGYSLVVGMTENSVESEANQLQLFREKSVDGIIVSNYEPETVRLLTRIADDNIPMIICDYEKFDSQIPRVKIDDQEAMRLLTAHLVEQGHRSFAYCYPVNAHSYERFEAHKRIVEAQNLTSPVLCENEEHLSSLLESGSRPTALVCYSDHIAIQVKHLVASKGLKIPDDIAITGFDDIVFSAWPEISLTTISQPRCDIGRISAELLFDMIDGKTVQKDVLLKPELIVRKSTQRK